MQIIWDSSSVTLARTHAQTNRHRHTLSLDLFFTFFFYIVNIKLKDLLWWLCFTMRLYNNFNFPLGWIKYYVIKGNGLSTIMTNHLPQESVDLAILCCLLQASDIDAAAGKYFEHLAIVWQQAGTSESWWKPLLPSHPLIKKTNKQKEVVSNWNIGCMVVFCEECI